MHSVSQAIYLTSMVPCIHCKMPVAGVCVPERKILHCIVVVDWFQLHGGKAGKAFLHAAKRLNGISYCVPIKSAYTSASLCLMSGRRQHSSEKGFLASVHACLCCISLYNMPSGRRKRILPTQTYLFSLSPYYLGQDNNTA